MLLTGPLQPKFIMLGERKSGRGELLEYPTIFPAVKINDNLNKNC